MKEAEAVEGPPPVCSADNSCLHNISESPGLKQHCGEDEGEPTVATSKVGQLGLTAHCEKCWPPHWPYKRIIFRSWKGINVKPNKKK